MNKLLLLLLFLTGGWQLYAQPVFYNETVPSSALRKEKNKDFTVFYVYQDDCGHCHDFQAKLNNDKNLEKWLRKKATLISRNAILPENRAFLQQYGLSSTPAIIWYRHSTNQSYVYENASDVTALYLSLLRTEQNKKYSRERKNRLSADPFISDELSASLFTHLDLVHASEEARQARSIYNSIRITGQEVSVLLTDNCKATQCTLDDELGKYLYEKRAAFATLLGQDDFSNEYTLLYARSIAKAYDTKDEDLFTQSLELELLLGAYQRDSLFSFRKLEFYSATGMHIPYTETALYIRNAYHENAAVLFALSKQWFAAFPQDINEVNALAARCVYLENTAVYRQWYARILRESGYSEEARLLEAMP